MNKKIMIVEDDTEIRNFIKIYLTNDGYQIVEVDRGDRAVEVFHKEEPDLVLLDIMLPGLDGIEVCRELRKHSIVPIIILSNKVEEIDKIMGLTIGADDYVTKPFSPRELTARIRTQMRRHMYYANKKEALQTLEFNDLKIDLLGHSVQYGDEVIELSSKEFGLLSYMAQNPGRVFKAEELFEVVWGEFSLGDTRTVMVHISSLRKKIEPDPTHPEYILTIRGTGYKFNDKLKQKEQQIS